VLIFRFKSFREVIERGREHRRGDATAAGAVPSPAGSSPAAEGV
jgi:hypothetical protein